MANKKKKKKFKAKEKRLFATVILLYAFSLVLDGLLTAFVLWPMESDMFWGAYGGYMILGSGLVGLLAVFFACLTSKNSESVRGCVLPCIITRGVVLLVSDIVLMLFNPTWCVSSGERDVVAGVITIVLLGGIFFGLQALICGWISENLWYPTTYVPTVTKHTGSGVSSVSSGHVIVTDAVKNTEFYKETYDKEYRKLMGYPPKDDTKSDYSDLDDHDYSHIFRDKNF